MSDALWLALTRIPGLGPKKLMALFNAIPNLKITDLYAQNTYKLIKMIVKNEDIFANITDPDLLKNYLDEAESIINSHEKANIKVISIANEYYPHLLRLIPDPPIVLYCKGNLNALKLPKKIAVVGTRNATPKGLQVAKKVASVFAQRGFVIVSGLALGIDSAGHHGALKVKHGITIAVMAGSLDKVYPKENRDLANEIMESNGLLISEYALGTKTFKNSFVQRDRIQSGLSLGICPVQTDITGGTQHTIKFAQLQKRIIFCPKPVESVELPAYRGVQKLLDEGKAELLSNPDDYEKLESIMIKNEERFLIDLNNSRTKSLVNRDLQGYFDLFSVPLNQEKIQSSYNSLEVELTDSLLRVKEIANRLDYDFEKLKNRLEKIWVEKETK